MVVFHRNEGAILKAFQRSALLFVAFLGFAGSLTAWAQSTSTDDGSATALPRRGGGGSTLLQKAIDQTQQDANDPQARERANRAQQDRAIAESEAVARQREAERRAEQKRQEDLTKRPSSASTGNAGTVTTASAGCTSEYRAMLQTFLKANPNYQQSEVYKRIASESAAAQYTIQGIDSGAHLDRALPDMKPGDKHSEHPGSLRRFADYALRNNDGARRALAQIPAQYTQQRASYQLYIDSAAYHRCFALARADQIASGRSGPTQLTAAAPQSASSTTTRDASGNTDVRPPPHIEHKGGPGGIAWDFGGYDAAERARKKAEADEEARKLREARDQKTGKDSTGGGSCSALLRTLQRQVLSGGGDEASKARTLGSWQKKFYTENCKTDANASQMVAEAEQMIRTGQLPAYLKAGGAGGNAPEKDGSSTSVSADLIKVCEGNYQGMRRQVEAFQLSAEEKNRMLAQQTLAIYQGRCSAVPGAEARVAAARNMLDRLGGGSGAVAGGGSTASPGNTASRPRRPNVPEAVANHCLNQAEGGGFQNSCPFTVHFKYCVFRPKPDTWSAALDCDKNQIGDSSVGAHGRTSGFGSGQRVHWAACKYGERNAEGKPFGYSPADVTWDSRIGRLTFRCTEW